MADRRPSLHAARADRRRGDARSLTSASATDVPRPPSDGPRQRRRRRPGHRRGHAMSPVGGIRHYAGKGLGEIGLWGCPSCGEDNTGPHDARLRPLRRRASGREAVDDPARPPRGGSTTRRRRHLRRASGRRRRLLGDRAPRGVSIADAYRAGYLDGVRAARAAQRPTAPPRRRVGHCSRRPKHGAPRSSRCALSRPGARRAPRRARPATGSPSTETAAVISELQQLLVSPRNRSMPNAPTAAAAHRISTATLILGVPGSGKTSLLAPFARYLWEVLPPHPAALQLGRRARSPPSCRS